MLNLVTQEENLCRFLLKCIALLKILDKHILLFSIQYYFDLSNYHYFQFFKRLLFSEENYFRFIGRIIFSKEYSFRLYGKIILSEEYSSKEYSFSQKQYSLKDYSLTLSVRKRFIIPFIILWCVIHRILKGVGGSSFTGVKNVPINPLWRHSSSAWNPQVKRGLDFSILGMISQKFLLSDFFGRENSATPLLVVAPRVKELWGEVSAFAEEDPSKKVSFQTVI